MNYISPTYLGYLEEPGKVRPTLVFNKGIFVQEEANKNACGWFANESYSVGRNISPEERDTLIKVMPTNTMQRTFAISRFMQTAYPGADGIFALYNSKSIGSTGEFKFFQSRLISPGDKDFDAGYGRSYALLVLKSAGIIAPDYPVDARPTGATMVANIDTLYTCEWNVCGFQAAIIAAAYNSTGNIKLPESNYNLFFDAISQFVPVLRNNKLLSETYIFSIQCNPDLQKKFLSMTEIIAAMKQDELMEEYLTFAITPNAMKLLCAALKLSVDSAEAVDLKMEPGSFAYQNAIYGIGVSKEDASKLGYNKLAHWVYADNSGNIITWGWKKPKQSVVEYFNTRQLWDDKYMDTVVYVIRLQNVNQPSHT